MEAAGSTESLLKKRRSSVHPPQVSATNEYFPKRSNMGLWRGGRQPIKKRWPLNLVSSPPTSDKSVSIEN